MIYRIFFFFAISSIAVFGRIGDTQEQMISRYGQPLEKEEAGGVKKQSYEKDGFRIFAGFFEGKVVFEVYSRVRADIEKLSYLEAMEIIKKEFGDDIDRDSKNIHAWRKEGIYALYDEESSALSISKTPEWDNAKQTWNKAKAVEATSGL